MNRSYALIVALVFGLAGFAASPASAEESSKDDAILVGYQPSWFLLGGATGGASFSPAGTGGFAGAEVSLVRTLRGWWSGVYLDGAYEFRSRAPTVSLGPEVGYQFVGLDAGGALQFTPDGLRPGIMGRLSATAGLLSLFGRVAYWPSGATYTVQAGATFKLPLIAPWGRGSTRGRSPPWTDPTD